MATEYLVTNNSGVGNSILARMDTGLGFPNVSRKTDRYSELLEHDSSPGTYLIPLQECGSPNGPQGIASMAMVKSKDFDGVDETIATTADMTELHSADEMTIFVVSKVASIGGNIVPLAKYNLGVQGTWAVQFSNAQRNLQLFFAQTITDASPSKSIDSINFAYSFDEPFICCFVYNGGASDPTQQGFVYKAGKNVTSVVDVPTSMTAGTAVTESGSLESGSIYMDGSLAEWMIFNRALSVGEVNGLGDYLHLEYQLPWN